MENSWIILDFFLSKYNLENWDDFPRLSIDCSLGDPVDDIARVNLKQRKDCFVDLFITNYCFGQFCFDVSKKIYLWRESINSRYKGILGIVEGVEKFLVLNWNDAMKFLNQLIELNQDVLILIYKIVLFKRLLLIL